MSRQIDVLLGSEMFSLGELRYDRQGRRENAAFAYTSTWLAAERRFAIDTTLPLVNGFQFHARRGHGSLFHGAISDTEPDRLGPASDTARPGQAPREDTTSRPPKSRAP